MEALRLELRSRERQGASTCPQTRAEARSATGVQYFPSHLTEDAGIEGGSERRNEQQEGPRTGSDLEALKAQLLDVQRREQGIVGTGPDPTFVSRVGRTLSPDGMGSKVQRQTNADRRPRPSSSGPRRRPSMGVRVEGASSLLRRCASDRVECPSGCGEEVRVSSLRHHQASACTLR